jgi:hypothetical protein
MDVSVVPELSSALLLITAQTQMAPSQGPIFDQPLSHFPLDRVRDKVVYFGGSFFFTKSDVGQICWCG